MMKTALLSLLLAATLPLVLAPAASAAHPWLDDPTAALLVIDIQQFYYPGGALPLVNPEAAGRNAGRLLAAFREHGRAVVHVGHKAKSGIEFHPDVAPRAGEKVFMKSEVNAFLGTGLLDHLRQVGVTKLVICGMQTHMCVEAATRAASDYGFKCIVVGDACATRDLSYGGVTAPAAMVHAATLSTLDQTYAQVVNTAGLLGER